MPFELRAHILARDVAITGKLVGEGTHVAGTLHVVLAPERINANTRATEVTGGHREVGHSHDHRRTLAVFGNAEAIVDGAVARFAVQASRGPNRVSVHARDLRDGLGRVFGLQDHRFPRFPRVEVAAFFDIAFVREALADDDVGQRVDDRYVRPRQQVEVILGLDVRRADEADPARVDDDELRALSQAALHLRRKHRMPLGGVRADHHDDVRIHDAVEGLRSGRRAERCF